MADSVRAVSYKVSTQKVRPLPVEQVHNGGYANVNEHPHTSDAVVDLDKPHPSRCSKSELQYGIDDVPPWYICIVLGFQHYLTMFGATVSVPLIMTQWICIGEDGVGKSEIISTIFFVSGIVTLFQSTFGTRLPIVQGGTFSFLSPIFAIMALDKWKCPADPTSVLTNGTAGLNWTMANNTTMGTEDMLLWRREVWQVRMREIQGAIIVASLAQVGIGMSGMIGIILRFIGPLAICPTIALIGLSLFEAASNFCSKQWGVALMTMGLILLFSQYLRNINIPCKCCKNPKFALFKLFPVILAIMLAWLFCIVLTVSGALGETDKESGYGARTDIRLDTLRQASWFRVPYPGQWGLPTVSVSAVFGMFAGVIAGMLESIGDYYACARLAGAPPPPVHSINRGIAVEGLGCMIAGLFGTGSGTTSYSENIGAIGITQVASRRVIQTGGLIMIVLGMLGKFGALFTTMPDPIVGGVFMVMFGMITAVGLSNLQYVDLNSSRNLLIFGFSIFFGLSLPNWIKANQGAISTGNDIADQIITVLLSTNMFVGGFVGFLLDNTMPGTAEERGIDAWRKQTDDGTQKDDVTGKARTTLATYDFPIGMGVIRKWSWTKYVPICPTFRVDKLSSKCCKKKDLNE